MNTHASARRFLFVTGNLPRWHYAIAAVFGGWLLYLRLSGSKPSFAHYFFLFLIPIFAGTGLISSARAGQLDLLFGAGEQRKRVWFVAVIHAFVIPVALGLATFSIGGGRVSILLFRLPAVLCFTAGVAFAVGLTELRYVTGIAWILVRFLFVATPAGLTAAMLLSKGPGLPSTPMLLMLFLAAPESALELRMPMMYPIAAAAMGLVALAASYALFTRGDFGGKHS